MAIERPNIIAVYDHYGLKITGRDAGQWRKAQCPRLDHEDNNPSGSVNEDIGKWHCQACNESGDGLDIIMEREALARLSDAQQFATSLFGPGDEHVREERGLAGILPRSSGNRAGRSTWRAPWSRL